MQIACMCVGANLWGCVAYNSVISLAVWQFENIYQASSSAFGCTQSLIYASIADNISQWVVWEPGVLVSENKSASQIAARK